ncbi:MAG: GntR family transcriptional regulator [Firmicutes bacterium]|nr:GntR family transcriptional regulator [Bacillota bacterium]
MKGEQNGEQPAEQTAGRSTQNQNTEDWVYQRIKTAIFKRYIGPNRQLVEETLATQLGVSRTPVRAAIRRLVYDGFVEMIPNRGAFVIKPTREEIEDAFAVRAELEGMACRLAATRVTPSDLEYLETLIKEEGRVFESRDAEAYYRRNDAFHLRIAELSGNETLRKYVGDIISLVNIYLILFDPFIHMEFNPSMDEHRAIVDRLRTGDPGGAERAMDEHLASTLAGLEWEKAERPPEDYLEV